MKIKKIVSSASFYIAVLASSVILTSCSCKITDEQLGKIADLRRQEKSINTEITNVQNERAKLNKELQARKAEADDCNEKRNTVRLRLSQWPNVWPDYTVEP